MCSHKAEQGPVSLQPSRVSFVFACLWAGFHVLFIAFSDMRQLMAEFLRGSKLLVEPGSPRLQQGVLQARARTALEHEARNNGAAHDARRQRHICREGNCRPYILHTPGGALRPLLCQMHRRAGR